MAHYGRLIGIMAPFRSLLSPKTLFVWDEVLENAFQSSKLELIEAIKDGVKKFDSKLRTCLSPDWSKIGIGYWLRQKHCVCDSVTPDCCSSGWKITLAGSRFLRAAEQNYAPVEGEALAIAWSLEDTRFFTMGCTDLVIATDHKPLVKIFGDKALDEITNVRILRLKQRTLMWNFNVVHVPGKLIPASDATSRNPSSSMDILAGLRGMRSGDSMEEDIIAANKSLVEKVVAITWDRVKSATQIDPNMNSLKEAIKSGFRGQKHDYSFDVQPFWAQRSELAIVDGVVMLEDRIVIPTSLRPLVCKSLHSAHQGVSGMERRAKSYVFWPGITKCIQRTRQQCESCNRMAPSQPNLPPVARKVPTVPFEAIAADYCKAGGYNYLITVDRFSNRPDVRRITQNSHNSGSLGLVKVMKRIFATFGVPEELSSDGGPEFAAKETGDFLTRWGVRHRISSAYHPMSNGRAEVTVKAMKRLLRDNVLPNGDVDSEAYVRAILQFRNTPDSDGGVSPSEILFGRKLRDVLPIKPRSQIFESSEVRPAWKKIWDERERTLQSRFTKQNKTLSEKTRDLPPPSSGRYMLGAESDRAISQTVGQDR